MSGEKRYMDYSDLYYSLFSAVTAQIRRLEGLANKPSFFSREVVADVIQALIAAQQKTEEMYIEDFRPETELYVIDGAGRHLEMSSDAQHVREEG